MSADTTIELWGIGTDEFRSRVDNIRAEMRKEDIDLLLLYSDTWRITDVGYVTNYRPLYGPGPSSMFVLLPVEADPILLTNDVHIQLAKDQQWIQDVRPQGDLGAALKDVRDKLSPKNVGLDGWGTLLLPQAKYSVIQDVLGSSNIQNTDIVTNLRLIKSEREIELLKQVGELNDRATKAAFDALEPGMREWEISGVAACEIFSNGGQLDLDTVWVASGENSAYNIHRPGSRKIQRGDLIHIDAAPRYMGYCSDADRTFMFGADEVSDEERDMYYAVIDSLDAGIKSVKAGVKVSEIARTIQKELIDAGYSDYLSEGHAYGHGIGIDMVEPPKIGLDVDTELEENMTICINSRLMKHGVGGALCEDAVQVTKTGSRIIQGNNVDRELIVE